MEAILLTCLQANFIIGRIVSHPKLDAQQKNDIVASYQEKRRKLDEAEERRLEGEWTLGPDCPEEGLKAHALLDYLVDENEVEVITNADREEIQNLENQIDTKKFEYEENFYTHSFADYQLCILCTAGSSVHSVYVRKTSL